MPKLLRIMGRKASNTWIYYTNRSPVSTNIWPEFATKLCFFGLVLEDGTLDRMRPRSIGQTETRQPPLREAAFSA